MKTLVFTLLTVLIAWQFSAALAVPTSYAALPRATMTPYVEPTVDPYYTPEPTAIVGPYPAPADQPAPNRHEPAFTDGLHEIERQLTTP